MLFDLLTEQDKEMINKYREWYTHSDTVNSPCPIDELLIPWANAKSQYLNQLFKDKLIVEFPIEYKQSAEELTKQISKLRFEDRRIILFINKLQNAIYCNSKADAFSDYINPFSIDSLATNKLITNVQIELNDGSIIKLQKGTKTIKVITKLAKSFNIGLKPEGEKINGKQVSDLEYFRLKHSVTLNQKILKGTLCLSIHPLDYMTMSDNCEHWSSCMSWSEGGDYRQGTVEMMNSPCVVVGYLKSTNHKMPMGIDNIWNSKKWRSLFIVDPQFIISIKGYPYQNEQLAKTCIDKLAQMAGWNNYNIINWDKNTNVIFTTNDHSMYNDFGTTEHYICLNPNSTDKIYNNGEYYNYCGDAECMWCGFVPEHSSEIAANELCCSNCSSYLHCDQCGCSITQNESYMITADDYVLCCSCWNYDTTTDDLTNDVYLYTNTIKLKSADENSISSYKCYLGDDTLADNYLLKTVFVNGIKSLVKLIPYNYKVELSELTFEGLKLFKIDPADLNDEIYPGFSSFTPEQIEELEEALNDY